MTTEALWIAILLAAVGSFFSALHMSLRAASRGALKALAGQNGKRKRLQPILQDVEGHALAVSLPRVLCNLGTVVAALIWTTGVGEGAGVTWGGLSLAAGVSLVLLYVLGVVVPTSVSDHLAEAVVLRCARLLRFLRIVTFPFIRLARFVDIVVKRLGGVAELTEAEELERELMSVVTEGEHEGSLKQSERDMIEAVVDFRTRTVQEIMTPRTEIEGFELTDDLLFIKEYIRKAGHSRIPVYRDDMDHIIGILYAKDLLGHLAEDPGTFRLEPVLREPRFFPETKPISDLLLEFQRGEVHLGIVLDEYGGTAGLVTIEDILEEIVGEIQDEFEPIDEAPPEITVYFDERAAEVEARANIHDVNDRLEDMGVELPEDGDYDTVGGFVLANLGHIPVSGETFRRNGFLVTVLDAEPTRVTRVRIEFRAEGDEEESAGPREEAGSEEQAAPTPADDAAASRNARDEA